MKKIITVLIASSFLTAPVLLSCNTPAEKVENAQNKVKSANEDLDSANQEYMADIESYKQETADKIAANEKSIAAFYVRIANEKADAKADYQKKIADLEQKNSDMKMKMDNYQAQGKENWESFKTEFNHDMQELGEAFKNLTVKNTK